MSLLFNIDLKYIGLGEVKNNSRGGNSGGHFTWQVTQLSISLSHLPEKTEHLQDFLD